MRLPEPAPELLKLITAKVAELESDPDAIMRPIRLSDFAYVGEPGNNFIKHGKWADATRTRVRSIRLLACLDYSRIGPYGDMETAPFSEASTSYFASFLLELNQFPMHYISSRPDASRK